jgi:hypothetical protein
VVWVKTEARGKSMPLDPHPSPEGNVVLVPLPQTRHHVARVLPKDQLPPADGSPAYLSHFVTCPGGRPSTPKPKYTSDCQLCGFAIEAKSRKAQREAWSLHYREEHLDRCPTCSEPVTWIRTEGDMQILMLDPLPVDRGDYVLVTGQSQMLARRVDRESLLDSGDGWQPHACRQEVRDA